MNGQRAFAKGLSFCGIGLWVLATLSTVVLPGTAIAHANWYLIALALVAFGLGHGARVFGWSSVAVMLVIAVVLSNIAENLSIATGIPFGFYTHQPVMGVKLFLVPIVVGPVYFGVTYIAWILARMILEPGDGGRTFLYGGPVVAALIVTGFDLCIDPIAATIQHDWRYPDGGGFYGVPLSNFVGWFVTSWAIFQAYAVFLGRRGTDGTALPWREWCEAPLMWALLGLQFPALLLISGPSTLVRDPSGWVWRSRDILETSAILSVYTVLAAALMAVLAAHNRKAASDPVAAPDR